MEENGFVAFAFSEKINSFFRDKKILIWGRGAATLLSLFFRLKLVMFITIEL